MPILSISTNLPKHKVPSTFLDDASKLVSQILKIPELDITVLIKAGQQMYWHDNDEVVCGLGSFSGTGICGVEENKYYASFLYDFLEKELGISQNRLYISFVEQKPSHLGVRSTTLEDLIQ